MLRSNLNRRSVIFVRVAALALALTASAAVLRAAESLRITPLSTNGKVFVTFELSDAYSPAIRDAIASGLKTTFTYELELRVVGSGWMDRTIATTVVSSTDQYDNLTRRHTLTRTVDGRVEEVVVTDDEATVKAWLTTWARVPLCDTSKLDQTRDYYVRVNARTRPSGSSLLGWTNSITGRAKFTFVP